MERVLGGLGIETPYPQNCSQASAPKPSYKICAVENSLRYIRARGYKTFFMLNSNEHEIFPAHIC